MQRTQPRRRPGRRADNGEESGPILTPSGHPVFEVIEADTFVVPARDPPTASTGARRRQASSSAKSTIESLFELSSTTATIQSGSDVGTARGERMTATGLRACSANAAAVDPECSGKARRYPLSRHTSSSRAVIARSASKRFAPQDFSLDGDGVDQCPAQRWLATRRAAVPDGLQPLDWLPSGSSLTPFAGSRLLPLAYTSRTFIRNVLMGTVRLQMRRAVIIRVEDVRSMQCFEITWAASLV